MSDKLVKVINKATGETQSLTREHWANLRGFSKHWKEVIEKPKSEPSKEDK